MTATDHYRIATVATLTGLPAATIRMWERRYAAVAPLRSSGGSRLYRDNDIERLRLLGELVRHGHAIGTIARLGDDELRQRLNRAGLTPPSTAAARRHRVLLIGDGINARAASAFAAQGSVELRATAPTLEAALQTSGPVDFVIVEAPTLLPDLVAGLQQLREQLTPRLLLVEYAFSTRATLRQLQRPDILCLRGPCEGEALARICLFAATAPTGTPSKGDLLQQALSQPTPPPRYTSAELLALDTAPSALRCECPRQLAELIGRLSAFERYSAECRNASPRDARLHEMLRLASGHARGMIEDALQLLLEAEDAIASGR
ncbi:MerR family transcriptional regulator [Solimonas marina]|uniref:MerR family transcriptional regulator n=1 Tax=Solimonas marina TaxID=2714601 RepID=A0A970B4R7_9GAMM|nr:MerR family transcriptional regulator [Solimonas marina]NKF20918.1 MerR family transcriptional regulator [Solimonas marina]